MFQLFVAIVTLTISVVYLTLHPLGIPNSSYSLKFHKYFVMCVVPFFLGFHLGDAILEFQNQKIVAVGFQLSHAILCLMLYIGLRKLKKYSYWLLLLETVVNYGFNFLATILVTQNISPYYEIDIILSVIVFALATMVFVYYENRKPIFNEPQESKSSFSNTSYIAEKSVIQSDELYCRKCGKRIPVDSVYCPNCGTKLQD